MKVHRNRENSFEEQPFAGAPFGGHAPSAGTPHLGLLGARTCKDVFQRISYSKSFEALCWRVLRGVAAFGRSTWGLTMRSRHKSC